MVCNWPALGPQLRFRAIWRWRHGEVHLRACFLTSCLISLVPSISSSWVSSRVGDLTIQHKPLGLPEHRTSSRGADRGRSEEEKTRSTVTRLSGARLDIGMGTTGEGRVAEIQMHLGRAVLNSPLAVGFVFLERHRWETEGSGTERKLRREKCFRWSSATRRQKLFSKPERDSRNVSSPAGGTQLAGHLMAFE